MVGITLQAAGRHQCSYLITLQKQEFLLQGGDQSWLKGLNCIPQKLRNLYDINKILAHRPWLLKRSHIEVSNVFYSFVFDISNTKALQANGPWRATRAQTCLWLFEGQLQCLSCINNIFSLSVILNFLFKLFEMDIFISETNKGQGQLVSCGGGACYRHIDALPFSMFICIFLWR